jgi:hypothetical protein
VQLGSFFHLPADLRLEDHQLERCEEVEPVSDLGGGPDQAGERGAFQQPSEVFPVCLREVEQFLEYRVEPVWVRGDRFSKQAQRDALASLRAGEPPRDRGGDVVEDLAFRGLCG